MLIEIKVSPAVNCHLMKGLPQDFVNPPVFSVMASKGADGVASLVADFFFDFGFPCKLGAAAILSEDAEDFVC